MIFTVIEDSEECFGFFDVVLEALVAAVLWSSATEIINLCRQKMQKKCAGTLTYDEEAQQLLILIFCLFWPFSLKDCYWKVI